MALAVIALAAVVCWHLRDDVRLRLRRQHADRPRRRAARCGARGVALEDNRYVTVCRPGRAPLRAVPRAQGRARAPDHLPRCSAPARACSSAPTTPRTAPTSTNAGPAGCVASTHMPYAAVAARLLRQPRPRSPATSTLGALKAALSGGAHELRDRIGEPLTRRRPTRTLVVDVVYPGELKVYLSKDKYPVAGRRAPRARAHGAGAVGRRRRRRTSSSSSCRCPRRARTRSSASCPTRAARLPAARGALHRQAQRAAPRRRHARASAPRPRLPWAQRQGRRRARAHRRSATTPSCSPRARRRAASGGRRSCCALLARFRRRSTYGTLCARFDRRAHDMTIRIHDTLSAQEGRLRSRSPPGKVGIYVCGPTVYDFLHVGNAPPARRLRRRGAPPARARLRRHLRPQHHRRRRQDHQPRPRARRSRRRRWPRASPTSSTRDMSALVLPSSRRTSRASPTASTTSSR